MTRRLLPLFLFGTIGLAVGAEEPKPDDGPVRLKKFKKPEAPKDDPAKDDKPKQDKKSDEKAKDDAPKTAEPGPTAKEDEKEVLERVARNMKTVEDRLINKEHNEGTRQLRDDIIKDIDSLIKMAETPPPSESQSSRSSAASSGAKEKGGTERRSQPGARQEKRDGRNQGTDRKNALEKNGKQPMNDGQEGNREGQGTPGKGVTSDREGAKLPNSTEDQKGKWGKLPESLRPAMHNFGNPDEYMPKYQDLIKEYTRNLAK